MEETVNIWSEEVVERAIETWGTVSTKWTKFAFTEAAEGDLIIDVGCGFGRFYKWLIENRKEPLSYIGVDGSDWMIRKCKQLYGTSEDHFFFVHDVLEPFNFIEVPWSCTILCNSVLIHLPTDQQDVVLKNILEAVPKKAVFDIEARGDLKNVTRIGQEMSEPFYRTWNSPIEFENKVRELFKDYVVTVDSFHFGKNLTRHVFVALSI